jgi:flagellar basal body-associated protein FliL
VLENGFLDSFSLKNYLLISITTLTLVGIIILSFLWTKRTKKQAVSALGFDEIEKLIENFKPHSGQLLDSEKLDSLLGIDSNGNADLARVKRSRMIIRVNKYYTSQKGKELIVREKNPKDKRYVYYKVDI